MTRPARSPARWTRPNTAGDSPPTVSGASSGVGLTASRGRSGGGSTGSPSICSIGVTSTTLLPYCPIPSEIAPAFSSVPNESGQ